MLGCRRGLAPRRLEDPRRQPDPRRLRAQRPPERVAVVGIYAHTLRHPPFPRMGISADVCHSRSAHAVASGLLPGGLARGDDGVPF